MKQRRRTTLVFLTVFLVIWFVLAMLLRYKVENDPINSFTVNINNEKASYANLDVSINVAQYWYNNKNKVGQTVGAQYDGTITSRYGSDITAWKLVITLPDDGKLDSYWNGEFTLEGNKLTIVPDRYINTIHPQEKRTFGFIMISDQLLDINEFEFTGYREIVYEDYALYWILLFGIGCWVIFAVAYVIAEIKTKQYEERRVKDGEIILQSMRTLAGMIDAKDPYTNGHSLRVASYSQELGRRMHLNEEQVRNLGYIALMHDCGKMGINDAVLSKPEKLTAQERALIQEHTVMGGHVLENFTAIEGIKEGALYHHERYDGSGYPEGLKGEEIPLCARIICVADAFDVMNTGRVYRSNLPTQVILEELEINKGVQFDPEVAQHMINMINEGFTYVEDILA